MSTSPPPGPPDISLAEPTRAGEATPNDSESVISGSSEVLFGVSFSDPFRAEEFLLALNRLAARRDLVLRDAVMVTKTVDGSVRVRETTDLQPATAAVRGAMWTGLLGLLIAGPIGWLAGLGVGAGAGVLSAKVIDTGIPDDWVDWFKDAVQPLTATVVALADDVNLENLYTEVHRFEGAHLVHTTMQSGASARLEEALRPASPVDHTSADPTVRAHHEEHS